jgi:hypothetical protein
MSRARANASNRLSFAPRTIPHRSSNSVISGTGEGHGGCAAARHGRKRAGHSFSFTAYAARAQGTGERSAAVSLEVSVSTLTEELQEYFGFRSTGSRSPEIPKRTWVKKTLDALVEFRLATRVDDERYVIAYKRTRKDTLLKFGSLCHKLQEKQNAERDEKPMLLPGINWQDRGSVA